MGSWSWLLARMCSTSTRARDCTVSHTEHRSFSTYGETVSVLFSRQSLTRQTQRADRLPRIDNSITDLPDDVDEVILHPHVHLLQRRHHRIRIMYKRRSQPGRSAGQAGR